MVVLDLILFLVVLLFAVIGVRRGLVLTLCGLLSIVVALFGARIAADSFSPVVAEAITPRLTTTVEAKLESSINDSVQDAGDTAMDGLGGILSIFGNMEPDSKIMDQIQQAVQSGLTPGVQAAAVSVAHDLAQPIAWWSVYAVAFFLVMLVWNLVTQALNLVAKLPVLNLMNRVLGGGIGLVKGVVVVGILCYLILRFGLVTQTEIAESVFLQLFSSFS